ncbi:hypothetical protein Btru_066201 [Bulinus truncatus]|nr:hypothetical protein Btru_066201 [Bulinus truncatus]
MVGKEKADLYVGNTNINIILSILFAVFALTIVMEVADLHFYGKTGQAIKNEPRSSCKSPHDLPYSIYESDSADPTPVTVAEDTPDSSVTNAPSTASSFLNKSAISAEIARIMSSVTSQTSDYAFAV